MPDVETPGRVTLPCPAPDYVCIMTSNELNDAIATADLTQPPVYECWPERGSPIPYMGWYWRDVDFNRFVTQGYSFGVSDDGHVGFMQNNKWDYSYVRATAEQCQEIHNALVKAVTTQTAEDFEAANNLIQAIKPNN